MSHQKSKKGFVMRKNLYAGILSLFVSSVAAQAADIQFTTEDYPPFNFEKQNKIVGLSADQAFEIMKRAGLNYEVEMMQWSRAIGLAERDQDYCVFSASITDERLDKFLWVEPLLVSNTYLIKKTGSDVNIDSIDEAKGYTVGTQSGDFTETILQGHSFPKIDAARNMDLTLKKLLADRIDLIAVSADFYEALKQDGVPVEVALLLEETKDGIACNLNTDPTKIAKMQDALNEMIADGTQDKILSAYK